MSAGKITGHFDPEVPSNISYYRRWECRPPVSHPRITSNVFDVWEARLFPLWVQMWSCWSGGLFSLVWLSLHVELDDGRGLEGNIRNSFMFKTTGKRIDHLCICPKGNFSDNSTWINRVWAFPVCIRTETEIQAQKIACSCLF